MKEQEFVSKSPNGSPVLRSLGLRRGMWVKVPGFSFTGILAEARPDGTLEIHMVGNDGATISVVTIDASMPGIRQASYAEIPEVRRPSESVATQLGYIK